MSTYSKPGKGWRYDFTLNGQRHTEAWFKTKRAAAQAEAKKREEIENPPETAETESTETQTGMEFLELINRRLDHVKAYNSYSHYRDYVNLAKRWAKMWGELECSQITEAMLEEFILFRNKVSAYTANKEIRYLRATFNFGIKRKYITVNPTVGLEFIPVEKKIKYVPPPQDTRRNSHTDSHTDQS